MEHISSIAPPKMCGVNTLFNITAKTLVISERWGTKDNQMEGDIELCLFKDNTKNCVENPGEEMGQLLNQSES